MTDKEIIEYKHIKCTKDDCCLYCGSIYCGYVDDIENLEKAYKVKEQECEILASQLDFEVQKKECLEQECERLKIYIESNEQQVKEVETLVMDNDRLINELDQLKFDNKILNSTISSLEETRDILANKIDQLKAENEKLEEQLELNTANAVVIDMVERLYKFKQALKEIKEIALKSDMPPCLDIDCKCEYCEDSVTNKGFNCMQYGLEQILQKISGVEDV